MAVVRMTLASPEHVGLGKSRKWHSTQHLCALPSTDCRQIQDKRKSGDGGKGSASKLGTQACQGYQP